MDPTIQSLRACDRRSLAVHLAAGHAFDPEALAGHVYHGEALGLPRWVERCAWKTFRKVFHRDRHGLRGWNVATIQERDTLGWRPRTRRGAPVTYGHFAIRPRPDDLHPRFGPGPLLDYGAFAGPLDPMGWICDPLVALQPDDPDALLGVSFVALGRGICTPTYFSLTRADPLQHVVEPPRGRSRGDEV